MKLKYWIAECQERNAFPCYNIRAQTKKECLVQLEQIGMDSSDRYGEPHKVTIEYDNAFDLMLQATGVGGLDEDDYAF